MGSLYLLVLSWHGNKFLINEHEILLHILSQFLVTLVREFLNRQQEKLSSLYVCNEILWNIDDLITQTRTFLNAYVRFHYS